jgi:hypothetical protein
MPKFTKGSQEAKDFMAKIREAKKNPNKKPPNPNKNIRSKNKKTNVEIPIMNTQEIAIPEFFATKNTNKKGVVSYKLVNPLTKIRNLSKRKGEPSIKLIRKPIEEMILMEHSTEPIPLSMFSSKDRETINKHFKVVETYKDKDINEIPHSRQFVNKPRGRPEKLQKNIEYHKALRKAKKPKKYATEEERKQAIKEQKKKSAKKIYDAKKLAKQNEGKGIFDYGKALIFGRDDYPPKVRKVLKDVGNNTIESIELRRTPLPFLLNKALDIISLGQFEKNKPYDTLYHLSMICKLNNGQQLLIEKNEVINMDLKPRIESNAESMPLPISKSITVNELMDNTKNRMGDKFFKYDANENNCQQFIVNVLRANNLNTPEAEKFVFQDLKTLFKKLPAFTKPIIDRTTDLGAKFNVLTQGAGIQENSGKVLKHLVSHITDPKEPIDTRDFNQAKMVIDDIKEMKGKHKGKGIKNKPKKNISNNNIMPKYRKAESDSSSSDSESDSDNDMSKIMGGGIHHHHYYIQSSGKGAFDFLNPKKNGLSKTFSKKNVSNFVEHKLPSTLIHKGIPVVSGVIGSTLASALVPEGGPVSGFVGNQLGRQVGNKIADEVGKKTGYGFKKGSQEAKDHMAKIRAMKGKGITGKVY